jgi:hypothetical protein
MAKRRFLYCIVCGGHLEPPKRLYDSNVCRQRAYRRRRAGVPEHFLYDGLRRSGRTSLGDVRERIQRLRALHNVPPPF